MSAKCVPTQLYDHLHQPCSAPIMSMPSIAHRAPAPVTTNSRWADLPHDLLVRIFASQPEPLHNLGAEGICRAWSHAVRPDADVMCLHGIPHVNAVLALLRQLSSTRFGDQCVELGFRWAAP